MSGEFLDGRPSTWIFPRESNGGIPVNVQDQTSEPIDVLFAKANTPFTLAADTVASGITQPTLNYQFTAVAGHGLAATDEIFLFDVAGNREFYAIVTNVAVNTITVDRPIDHVFLAATAVCFNVSTNMAVNGSVTQQIFSLNAGSAPIDITRVIISMIDDTAMDDGKFGGISALSNGLVFRIVNGFQKTIFNFKTNGEIAQFCYDVRYADKAPAGLYGLTSRITFAGQDKHGVALRISGTDVLQWVIQDDLTALSSVQISAQGHYVTD